jgi:hypothetical protein
MIVICVSKCSDCVQIDSFSIALSDRPRSVILDRVSRQRAMFTNDTE